MNFCKLKSNIVMMKNDQPCHKNEDGNYLAQDVRQIG